MQLKRRLPSIKALQAFESAARLGSFTHASVELHVAQSAISRQVRGLEERLGARLFDLIRQRIVLTQAGQIFVEELRPVLANLGASCARVSAFADGVQLIEMATLPTFCSRWLIPRLPDYYAQNQRASISLRCKRQTFELQLFENEMIDRVCWAPGRLNSRNCRFTQRAPRPVLTVRVSDRLLDDGRRLLCLAK